MQNAQIPGLYTNGWIGKTNIAGDFNGDGRTDVLEINYSGDGQPSTVFLSKGDGSFTGVSEPSFSDPGLGTVALPGDYAGNGKTGVMVWLAAGMGYLYQWSKTDPIDTLTSFQNAIGGGTAVTYLPLTKYSNTQLPFPVKTVNSVTADDGNGNLSSITYAYSGGFYHIGERDFRGFNYVKATGPVGTDGEQAVTETHFHQGNDVAFDVNNPNVPYG